MEEHVKQLAQMLQLSSVHFCGHVTDVTEIWRTHHALVLASRGEGLPLAAMEAMLCGRPCILTDAGGNSEILVDGESGFLASGATVRALDEAMERAWSQRRKSSGIRQGSRRPCSKTHSSEPRQSLCGPPLGTRRRDHPF